MMDTSNLIKLRYDDFKEDYFKYRKFMIDGLDYHIVMPILDNNFSLDILPLQLPHSLICGIPFSDISLSVNEAYRFFDALKDENSTYLNHIDFSFLVDDSELAQRCTSVMRSVISNVPKENLEEVVLSKMNVDAFVSNMKYFQSLGISDDFLVSYIVNKGNNFLSVSIEEAFSNYQYLLSQNILPENILQKLFFDGVNVQNSDKFKEYLQIYHQFPPLLTFLLKESSDENRLEMRDRLIYISTMNLLNDFRNKEKIAKAVIMMQRSVFENIVLFDKKSVDEVDFVFSHYNDNSYLQGLKLPLYKKLRGIHPDWCRSLRLADDDENTQRFLQSLTTVQNWDSYPSKIDRANCLKNEIVGRLLFADILLSIGTGEIRGKSASQLEKAYRDKNKEISHDFSDLLFVASYSRDELFGLDGESLSKIQEELNAFSKRHYEFGQYYGNGSKFVPYVNGFNLISTLLSIDPYSFTALRNAPHEELVSQSLETQYLSLANRKGYYFSDKDLERYRGCLSLENLDAFFLKNNVNVLEYLNDKLTIPKIPKEDKQEYLGNMRMQMQEFISQQSDDNLLQICASLDLYLRSSDEYRIQSFHETDELSSDKISNFIFDATSDVSQEAKIFYCMFSMNRLAHRALEKSISISSVDAERCSTFSERTEKENMRTRMRKAYRNLKEYDKYEFNADVVEKLYGFAEQQVDGNIKIYEDELRRFISTPDDRPKICEAINSVFDCLTADKEQVLALLQEEDTFFECKSLFASEIMKRLGIMALNNKGLFQVLLGATPDEKREFFAEHGYVAEVQDGGSFGPTLACYCKEFKDSFSIHLKGLPPYLQQELEQVVTNPSYIDSNIIATVPIKDTLRLATGDIVASSDFSVSPGFNNSFPNTDYLEFRDAVAMYNQQNIAKAAVMGNRQKVS